MAQEELFSYGFTSATDAGTKVNYIQHYEDLYESGELKLRIYAMYLGMPDTKAALAFLKREYGSYYGHSQTYQDGSSGIVNYSPKGITFQRFSPSGSFSITWNRAAARLKA